MHMDRKLDLLIDLNDYVNRKETTHPTGIVKAINEDMATVLWGVSDQREYLEDIPLHLLDIIRHKIVSADEIARREAERLGVPYSQEEDTS